MEISEDWVLSHDGLDFAFLLQEWRWLVDASFVPFLLTAMGDVFFYGPDHSVHLLDTGVGRLNRIADDAGALESLATDDDNLQQWFRCDLLDDLYVQGMTLEPGQCYGYKLPPSIGGQVVSDNVEPTSLPIHFGILGQVARQASALPPGAAFDDVTVVYPGDPSNFASVWTGLREIERNKTYRYDALNFQISTSPEVAAYMVRYEVRGNENELADADRETGKRFPEGTAELQLEVGPSGDSLILSGKDYVDGVPEAEWVVWSTMREGRFVEE